MYVGGEARPREQIRFAIVGPGVYWVTLVPVLHRRLVGTVQYGILLHSSRSRHRCSSKGIGKGYLMRLLVATTTNEYIAAVRYFLALPSQAREGMLPMYSGWQTSTAIELLKNESIEQHDMSLFNGNARDDELPDPMSVYAGNDLNNVSASIVVGLAGSIWAYTAALYAHLTARRLIVVENIASLGAWLRAMPLPEGASITVCAEPEMLRQHTITALFDALSDDVMPGRGVLRNGVGVLTAPTLGILSFLVLKNVYYPENATLGKPLLISPFLTESTLRMFHRGDLLARENASARVAQMLFERPRTVIALYGHGHEDCFFLGHDVIKSKSTPMSPLSAEGGSHPETIIATADVKGRVIFANTCAGLQLGNGLVPIEDKLGLSFAAGWASCYLAPTLVKGDASPDTALFLHLLASGYSTGEAMQAVNAVQAAYSSDPPSYLLLGDPELRVTRPIPLTHLEATARYAEGVEYLLQVPLPPAISISISERMRQDSESVVVESRLVGYPSPFIAVHGGGDDGLPVLPGGRDTGTEARDGMGVSPVPLSPLPTHLQRADGHALQSPPGPHRHRAARRALALALQTQPAGPSRDVPHARLHVYPRDGAGMGRALRPPAHGAIAGQATR